MVLHFVMLVVAQLNERTLHAKEFQNESSFVEILRCFSPPIKSVLTSAAVGKDAVHHWEVKDLEFCCELARWR